MQQYPQVLPEKRYSHCTSVFALISHDKISLFSIPDFVQTHTSWMTPVSILISLSVIYTLRLVFSRKQKKQLIMIDKRIPGIQQEFILLFQVISDIFISDHA